MQKLVAALLVVFVGGCAHQQAKAPAAGLVGTWRLVEFWNRDAPDQAKQYPFGEQPLGFFVYDGSGNVFIQIARNPRLPRISHEKLLQSGVEELRATVDAYVAYFGTYSVDAARGVVIHHVTADMRREYAGTDQERPFQLTNDELRIGDGQTWFRRLIRVR